MQLFDIGLFGSDWSWEKMATIFAIVQSLLRIWLSNTAIEGRFISLVPWESKMYLYSTLCFKVQKKRKLDIQLQRAWLRPLFFTYPCSSVGND